MLASLRNAALCASVIIFSGQAEAATIVRSAVSNNGPAFVDGFDIRLGTLNKVTVDSSFFTNLYFRYFTGNGAPIVSAVGKIGSTGLGFYDFTGQYQSLAQDINIISLRISGTAQEVTTRDFANFTGRSVFLAGTPIGTFSVGGSELETAVVSFPGSIGGRFTVTYEYTPFANVVPEPATWALMLAGFGMVGYAMRRRRPRVVYA